MAAGSKPGGDDGAKRARGGMPICGPRFPFDGTKEPGDAVESLKFPLPRAEACCDRRLRGLYPTRVEDDPEPP